MEIQLTIILEKRPSEESLIEEEIADLELQGQRRKEFLLNLFLFQIV